MIQRWHHKTRGVIVGEVIAVEGPFTRIRFAGNQVHDTWSMHPIVPDGTILALRTNHLTEDPPYPEETP